MSSDNPAYIVVALVASLAVLWICTVILKRDKLLVRLILLSLQLAAAVVSLLIFRLAVQERNPLRGNSAIAVLIAVGVIALVFVVGAVAAIVSLLRRSGKWPEAPAGPAPSGPMSEC